MKRTLLMTALSLGLLPAAVAAAPPVADVAKALGLARDLAGAADILDRLTEAKGQPIARAAHAPAFERLELSACFRVPGVEVRDHLTNEVLGHEVPGRRVEVILKVDCVVRCTIDPRAVEVATDPDYSDTVSIILPAVRVSADFAEDSLAEYAVEYGGLRSPLLDRERAAELRCAMYAAARGKAADTFGKASLPAVRDDLARELEKLLRKKFPDKRVYVRGGR